MPLPECIPASTAGLYLRNKPMSDLPSDFPNADLVEFQWGDGQIFMQDQQSKHNRKIASSFDVDVDVDFDVDGIITHQEPEDDLATWLNYTTDDYGSEFLSESTSPGPNKTEDNTVFPKTFAPGSGTDITTAPCSDHCRTQMGLQWTGLVSDSKSSNPTWEFPDSKLQMEVQISPPSTRDGSGLVNFSHFARPVSRLKPSLQNVDRMTQSNEKASTTAPSSSPVEPPPSADPKSILLQEQLPPVEPQTNQGLDGSNNNNNNNNNNNKQKKKSKNPPTTNLLMSSSASSRQEDLENSSYMIPTMVASSSSSDHKYRFKRKTHEEPAAADDSGYQSHDVDDHDPIVAKKAAVGRGGSNPKRSRAAEVHNLSERRRRDRINEKMRALQELIPNCNKTDKASMLDEAIEYLKTLQFQVQIMSMSGGGLCMPPAMILPQAMQHPQMAHFSPMGFGMGMGMFDMNAPPMFQMPAAIPGTPKFRCSNPGVPMTANSVGFPIFGHPSMSVNHLPSFAPLPAPIAGLNNCPINMNSEIGGSNIIEKEDPPTVAAENGGSNP